MKPNYQQFKNTVMEHYGEYGRHDLPWRLNQSPYYVLVSEIMLQQTQVDRVIPFFEKWMEQFPDIQTLATAKQSDVLRLWKGLGYNSRALRLQKCAQVTMNDYFGVIPQDYKKLLDLPGIGPYTAAALMNFAFNTWTPLIETNIRRIFIHHFFKDDSQISDTDIMDMVESVGFCDEPKIWCSALMDYGSTLPKIIKHNPNIKSKHYTKQSKFEGSDRQIRGMILEILLEKKNGKMLQSLLFKKLYKLCHQKSLCHSILDPESQNLRYKNIITKLITEGFIIKEKKSIILK
ncbi:MAG: A/G-specific adenine glycosylase [Candidatus Pacebacteria bacterium]|nr:A/G-specific adenine glycosylase [Candidatus Paceibacterota bacterium]